MVTSFTKIGPIAVGMAVAVGCGAGTLPAAPDEELVGLEVDVSSDLPAVRQQACDRRVATCDRVIARACAYSESLCESAKVRCASLSARCQGADEAPPEETKPEETKPEETKPEETKPEETKPEETKPEETKPEETKPKSPEQPPITEGFDTCQGKATQALPSFDFGAVGYRKGAVIPTKPATMTFAAGRHTIKKQILLKSGDVLRGAGREKTVLYFPGGLKQMGLLCRDGKKITVTGGGTGDCFDWTSNIQFMGVIGLEGSETGLEDLTIEFPADHAWKHYGNYNYTSGYNGVDLKKCTNCWIKNVTIKHADNGIFVNRGGSNTLTGVHIHARAGGAHLHIAYVASSDILTINFRMYGRSSHGLTMNWGATNGVFANGWGENLDIEPDHSCGGGSNPCSKNMLYSNISGTIRRFQTKDRAKKPVPAVRWNVGSVDRCPLDAYRAQK